MQSQQLNARVAAYSCLHLLPLIKLLSCQENTCMTALTCRILFPILLSLIRALFVSNVFTSNLEQIVHSSKEWNGITMELHTKATVRSTVAISAVTHFFSSGCDHTTGSIILTRVCATHWTHQDTQSRILRTLFIAVLVKNHYLNSKVRLNSESSKYQRIIGNCSLTCSQIHTRKFKMFSPA